MTTGELVFYSGVGLLAFTLVLAVIFAVKRPKYVPESLSHTPGGAESTQRLRSGYPTDAMTHPRTDSGKPSPSRGTVPLEQETAPLEQGTVPLEQGTVPLEQGTAPLEQGTVPLDQ